MTEGALKGLRILVVEDDRHVAEATSIGLSIMGAEVLGPYGGALAAEDAARTGRIDAAILDVRLGDALAYRVADVLRARDVPFVFATAYPASSIPDTYADVPHWEKPYSLPALLASLADIVAAPSASCGLRP